MLVGIVILACWLFLGVYWNISARSVKPTAEGQDWSGRLARMPIWLGYILLIVIWAMTDRGYFCPIWPILGWGIALVIHYWTVFRQKPITEDEIRREMERGG